MAKQNDILFSPSEAHDELRENVLKFAKQELDSQAKENDESETFNKEVFKNWQQRLAYSE
jgi:isovaleryl-CoA dehydrogenase